VREIFLESTSVVGRLFLAGLKEDRGDLDPNRRDGFIRAQGFCRGSWSDAETFLDLLETAALEEESSPLAMHLASAARCLTWEGKTAPEVSAMRDTARRMLAMECSGYLLDAHPSTERWEPHQRWRRSILQNAELSHHHTIVTFNYDRVLEILQLANRVVLPDVAPPTEGLAILKLHGSVDWRRTEGGEFEMVPDQGFLTTCAPKELAIAPPGPAKSEIVAQLESLWKAAESRISAADVIFFIGYRFPETDATARRRILGAISDRSEVNIVLGPNRDHPDIVRLQGLLEFIAPNRKPKIHPMWAQDFLSVFPTGLLTPSNYRG
jgi:hypothetical protein